MTDKVMIGVLGKSGSGKDEFCKAVLAKYGETYLVERIALADALKAEVDELGPLSLCTQYEIPYDHSPPTNDPMCSTVHGKQRQLLQFWGQRRRESNPFYWIKKLEQRINQSPARLVIVPDIRYKNETYFITTTGFTVRVTRPGHVGLTGLAAEHISETELNHYKTDYTIENTDLHTMHHASQEVFADIVKSFELQTLGEDDGYD